MILRRNAFWHIVGVSLMWHMPIAGPVSAQEGAERLIRAPGKKQLYRKIVIKDRTKIVADPKAVDGPTVDAFAIFHQLKTDDGKEQQDGFVRVGIRNGDQLGWVPAKHVYNWDTRLLLYPHDPRPGHIFEVYRDRELKTPLAAFSRLPKGYTAIAPILDRVGSEADPIFRVAFFAGKVRTRAPAAVREDPLPVGQLVLEVVFVVDSTGSMQPMIDSLARACHAITRDLATIPSLKNGVRFGLVEYRDVGDAFVARQTCELTSDHHEFLRKLEGVRAEGGGDIPEQVLEGLRVAITGSRWASNSSKHIVLIGDAAAHVGEKSVAKHGDRHIRTIGEAIKLGRSGEGAAHERERRAITFHAVRALAPGADGELCRNHFQEVATNDGEAAGLFLEVEPRDARALRSFESKLTDAICRSFRGLAVARENGKRSMEELAAATGANEFAHALYRIVATTQSSEPPAGLSDGWAGLLAADGKSLSEIKVMVTREEALQFADTLEFLSKEFRRAGSANQRQNLGKSLGALQRAVAHFVAGQANWPETNASDLIHDLPVKTKAMTLIAADLARMTDGQYADWIASMNRCRDRLNELVRAVDWIDVANGAGGTESYLFLKLNEIP